jgi:signal transduction histidine kinase
MMAAEYSRTVALDRLRKTSEEATAGMPFGIQLSLDAFNRVTRFAKGLLDADESVIVLTHEGQHWRSRKLSMAPDYDIGAATTLETGKLMWVEDAPLDERFRDAPLVAGPPYIRGYVGVPIRLKDGATPGALTVISMKPLPYDNANAERLQALADFVADEWVRAQIAAEHAEALERARRTEERLNLALALTGVHVWELDYRRRELFKAGAEDTFFERPQTYEDLFRDVYVTVDERDRERVEADWERHQQAGTKFQSEYRIRRTDGREPVWVRGALEYFADPQGRPLRMVGAMQDIRERKSAETALVAARDAAEAANRAKSSFLATMSHEIRTPLNGVIGMAQAMAADELSPAQRQRLEIVRQSSESLLAILNDVLDISKIEAGKLALEETVFDIEDLAQSAGAGFTAIAEAKGVRLDLSVAPAARGSYRGDVTRVRQILSNLISNGLKFTDTGSVTVKIRRVKQALRLSVSDTGIGIAPDALKRLFNRFEQADASTTRQFGGTGLGLAVCRELAELMGGRVQARSRLGHGSTFTVDLPLPQTAAARPAARTAEQTMDQDRPLRILAAEDNEVNRLVLSTLLQQAGVDPVMVPDGRAAVEAWASGAWDLILMDIQMPEMDGPSATRAIREQETAAGRPRTPIIALTANAMPYQLAEYRAAGMDGVVTKPIQVAELFQAIDAALDQAGAAAAAAA